MAPEYQRICEPYPPLACEPFRRIADPDPIVHVAPASSTILLAGGVLVPLGETAPSAETAKARTTATHSAITTATALGSVVLLVNRSAPSMRVTRETERRRTRELRACAHFGKFGA